MSYTDSEIAYLKSQFLGRLATVTVAGEPQNSPVGVHYNPDTATIDIGGYNMGRTRKFRNVRANGHVALVVDDIVSTKPWTVRGLEIRGMAEALTDVDPPMRGMSREVIRVHPRTIFSWGIEPDQDGVTRRDVRPEAVS